ncbi:mitochondrial 50S ribosomal protein L5 [Vararia minispora EC-137]|uniref:Mitochondrial 50S ribosomal protein L5 n=1 Tax=Vararia minispora EC-137 TaxID=1314806 RepID=A0ACB8QU44_9AGAM|nr:mitochondrial 50S ribosomal protein L5 [Vararia minispora EC-137]
MSATRFRFPQSTRIWRHRTAAAGRRLPRDERGLPIPHVDVVVRDAYISRLGEHYHNTLQDDLMYMTYQHEFGPRGPARIIRPRFDLNDPYAKNRHNPPVGGNRVGRKIAPPTTADNVVRLERIQIHTMIKDAIHSRQNLLGAIILLRQLSGQTERGGGVYGQEGVQIVKARKSVAGWTRPGLPLGAKVDIKGPEMWEFLGTLTEFVLPRLRDFNGFLLPNPSANMKTPAAVSGVYSFGLPPAAMGLFPQVEVNLDAYPKSYGMHIHFVTNAEGFGAQNKVRALLSGYGFPFARKDISSRVVIPEVSLAKHNRSVPLFPDTR